MSILVLMVLVRRLLVDAVRAGRRARGEHVKSLD
jgi:hypothetical protein